MFIVKATYRGVIRKLTFPNCFSFPSFDQLCDQLRRVFPLSNGFAISRLFFSPNSNNSIRILIGQKIHVTEDYIRCIEPYKNRIWPDATLRLTVQDGGPLEGTSPERSPSYWTPSLPGHNTFNDAPGPTIAQTPHSRPMIIPPPPILFPSCTIPSTPDPKPAMNASTSSCCPIDASKKEIQTLINNFLRDLNGALAQTFPPEKKESSRHLQRGHACGFALSQSSPSSSQTTSVLDAEASSSSTATANSQPARSCSMRGKPSRPLPTVPVSTRAIETGPRTSNRIIHNAACDLCDSGIRGVRYKCIVCPDFDACESCFTITNEQHPSHSFVRIFDPDDYIHRPKPRASHRAACNVCNNLILGARYKCLHPDCPDFDLCDRCESHPIPLHPVNHPMLKLKSVDMAVDIIQSSITTGQLKPSTPETNVSIAGSGAEPAMTRPEPPISNGKQSKDVNPSKSDADTQTYSQLETDIYNWKPAFLPPETQISSALNSPALSGRGRSEMTSKFLPSDISEIRITPIESPATNAMLVCLPEGDLVAETSMSVSSPASLMGKAIERDGDTHVPLMALHVCDVTVPSGQTFPPGAEFVKSWRVRNNGTEEWPDTTELIFTGGDAMTAYLVPTPVGSVRPGVEVELSTQVLKAPDVLGNYLGCWTLRTQGHGDFGERLWVNINVVEQSESSVESLSSSSIIKMPQSVPQGPLDDKEPSPTSERLTDETLSDMGSSDAANLSLDDSDWQEFPTAHGEQEEYVILYDDSSSDGH